MTERQRLIFKKYEEEKKLKGEDLEIGCGDRRVRNKVDILKVTIPQVLRPAR